MNKNILIFSDIHIAKHKHSVDRLNDCLRVLEWIFETAEQRNIQDIICIGDLLHDRELIDVMTYNLTFDILYKYCNNEKRLWLLLGNHDLWYHDKWDISSVKPFAAISGITVISEPKTLEIAGHMVDFLPYTHDPIEHLRQLRANTRDGRKTLFAHLAIDGSQLNTMHNTHADVVIEHDGEMIKIDSTRLNGWDKVWLGHYHGHQKVSETVEYIGSPLQLSFGEAFQHKHIAVYNLENGGTEYIRNKFSPQHFIIPQEDIDKYEINKNFIRLSVNELSNTGIVDIKKNIQELNPGSLEFVKNSKANQELVVESSKLIFNKWEETLDKWVEQVDTGDLDKKRLSEIGKKLCQNPIT